jgi:glutamyl-tRNA reductase
MRELNHALSASKSRGPTFFCVGSNHRTAGISTRENFYLTPVEINLALQDASQRFKLDELAILSTCNRCEIIGVADGPDKLTPEFLYSMYRHVHTNARDQKAFTSDSLSQSVYILTGIDAVRHTFQVAASLDSLVPGETQITGQFKDAINLAKNAGTLGSMLIRLSQEALGTAKKIRSNTDIGRHRVSIAHAAIDLARRASEDLTSLKFLIIGAGEMARVAAEYASSHRPKELILANRTSSRAFELCQHLGYGESHGLENLQNLIARADVVITATTAANFIIRQQDIVNAAKGRGDGPLFLIDIALPRNIEPEISNIDDVYLFDIDDLREVVESHIEKRRESLAAAADIVSSSVTNFEQWLYSKDFSPIMSATSQYFMDLCKREAEKTLAKDIFSELSQRQHEAINAMLEAISSKMTSDVAQTLKKLPESEARQLADVLETIYKRD